MEPLRKNDTWYLVTLPNGMKTIESKQLTFTQISHYLPQKKIPKWSRNK